MSRPLRVLSIGHSYVVALNRVAMRELARDKSLDLTVVAPSFFRGDLRPIDAEPEPPDSPLKVVRVGARLTRKVHVFSYRNRELSRLIATNPDIIHVWEEPYTLSAFQIAQLSRRCPARFAFWTAQNYDKEYPPPFDYFERFVLERSQGWLACAELVRETLIRRGYPSSTCRTINLPVDTERFRPLSERDRLERQRSLGLQSPVIGYMGRLNRDKGLDVLMQAVQPLRDRATLLFLGGGEYESKVDAWMKNIGIVGKILSVPHDEVPTYLGAIDMLLAPSQTMPHWKEQFGRMITEAFASGVPVIGSDSGEIPFVVGDAGVVVGEKDVSGWTAAIRSLLISPERRAELRVRGLERVKRFSVGAIADQYREFFAWLATQPRRPMGATLHKR